jgi:ubiquinone/menaquinone biosynthesis C-methylase UbiE
MSTDETPATWATMASWYNALLTVGSGPHELATTTTLQLASKVDGQTVLDVACGQGIASRALANAGAGAVVGVDSTAELLAIADEHEQEVPLGIHYRLDDAQRLDTVPDGSVDGVTCQLGLMDIPDLDATLRAVRRVLRPRGWFVFVIGHPCFLAPHAATLEDEHGRPGRFIADYFEERFWRSPNSSGVRRVGNFHRTASTYLNALIASNFALQRVVEPAAGPLLREQQPVFAHVPIFFAARARRT